MTTTSHLETKAGAADLGFAFDDFMRAFEAFKETNDERLGQLERRASADVADRPRSSTASTARSTRTSASSTSWR